MEWWQTAAVATAPAVVALSGVLIQSRIASGHQRALRDSDAREARELRAEDRRNAIEDHWRDRRHEAHVEALDQLQTAQYDLTTRYGDWANDAGSSNLHLPLDQVKAIRRSVADVALVCGAESNRALDHAFSCLIRSQSRLVRLGRASSDRRDRADEMYGETEERLVSAIDEYREAIRAELGTAD